MKRRTGKKKVISRWQRLGKKWQGISRKRKHRVVVGLQLGVVAVAVVLCLAKAREVHIMKNAHYTPLLNTIAKGESGGNYNAYYGNGQNSSVIFTAMTIGQVLGWQSQYARQGSPSTAVGKYQIIRPTLNGLVTKLKIDPDTVFDQAMQDRLAVALLERRGLREYLLGKATREEFAHNLSKEWAALPAMSGPNVGASYYHGDGLNKVRVSQEEIIQSIDALR